VRFVRFALKVVAQNYVDFLDVIQLNVQYTFRRLAIYTDGITFLPASVRLVGCREMIQHSLTRVSLIRETV